MTDPELAQTVDIERPEATIRAGETVSVAVHVENEDSEACETTVELAADDSDVESESLELDGEERETVNLNWTPETEAVGTVELTAATETDAVSETVTVENAPAEFAVDIDATDEHVSQGGTVTVVVDVTNEGTLAGSQDIEFRASDDIEESRRLDLDGQAEETIEFHHAVTATEAPETTLTVASEDDEAETSVPVVTETVTPLRQMKSKSGMGVFGYLMFAGMAILLLPLLPLLAVLKLVDLLTGGGNAVR